MKDPNRRRNEHEIASMDFGKFNENEVFEYDNTEYTPWVYLFYEKASISYLHSFCDGKAVSLQLCTDSQSTSVL